jgi:hypothetical protein
MHGSGLSFRTLFSRMLIRLSVCVGLAADPQIPGSDQVTSNQSKIPRPDASLENASPIPVRCGMIELPLIADTEARAPVNDTAPDIGD